MSLMDKLKSLFSGGSGADAHDDSHAGHDHPHGEHPAAAEPPVAPLDPLGTPPAAGLSDPPPPDDRP